MVLLARDKVASRLFRTLQDQYLTNATLFTFSYLVRLAWENMAVDRSIDLTIEYVWHDGLQHEISLQFVSTTNK